MQPEKTLRILAIILFILLISWNIIDLFKADKDTEFARKLFETSYKAGQVNEAYKTYMFRVNHRYVQADSLYKVDSVKIDSMICNYF